MKLIDYIRLLKFRYHIFFISVIIGALMFADKPFYLLLAPLFITYVSFNVLLYGGLYTLNDIADIESDGKHPHKRNRPLPSKRISIPSALIFALSIIFIGLAIGYLYFGINVFLIYLLFILINQVYTHIAKKIPYIEILFNSLTHPLRFFLGVVLVGAKIPYLFILAIFFAAIGAACVRRLIERKHDGWEARKVLMHYTQKGFVVCQIICFIVILALLLADYPLYFAWYAILAVAYLIFVFGVHFSPHIFKFLRHMSLN